MAIIKSFTSLQQSKKLAEILPPESADHFHIIGHHHTDGPRYEVIRPRNEVVETDKYWPCWSLAALLDVLPDRTCVYKKTYKDGRVKYQGIMDGSKDLILKDNPVDACVEMIEKLKELNLL